MVSRSTADCSDTTGRTCANSGSAKCLRGSLGLSIRAFDASQRSDLAMRDRRAGILNRHEFRQAEVS